MMYIIISAIIVALIGGAFTFWLVHQNPEEPPKPNKKNQRSDLHAH